MRDQLRAESRERGICADSYPRRAINEVPAADTGMSFDDQLRAPIRLMCEMPAAAERKTGDPIKLTDNGVRTDMQQVDVLADGEVADSAVLFHHESVWKNPRQPNVARRVDGVAKLPLEQPPPHRPGQHGRQQHQKFLQHVAPSD